MSVLSNNLETKSYTLFLSSTDKISGNNNSAQFQVNWADFLPRDVSDYKMSFSFQSGGGYYKDAACTFTGTWAASSNQLTVSAATGSLAVGQLLTGAGLLANTYILAYGTGVGGNGVYTLSKTQTLAGTGVAMTGNIVYSGCKIVLNTQGRSYSFDTTTQSESFTLGYAQRDIQTGTSTSNSFSAFYLQFPPKTVSRPNQNIITINLYNLNNNFLLNDTDVNGKSLNDCTPWNIIIEFSPINEH
jgi:hypothetical protein